MRAHWRGAGAHGRGASSVRSDGRRRRRRWRRQGRAGAV